MCWILGLTIVAIVIAITLHFICDGVHRSAKSLLRSEKPILILQNYNPEGGFFWQLYNVLNLLFVCEQQGFHPVVLFDTGLYFEQRPEFVSDMVVYDKQNWFNHFFYPINHTQQSDSFWLSYLKQHRVPSYVDKVAPVMMFGRDTLQSVTGKIDSFTPLWQRYVKVLPHIQQKVDAFKMEQWKGARQIIGLHYRGTDKLPSADGDEDGPVHMEYEFCYSLLKKHQEAALFVATDEQPLIEFLQSKQLPVTYTTSVRSAVSTSGLSIDTHHCSIGQDRDLACQRFNELIHLSVHRGLPAISKYVKGENVLIDVLLLASCTVFYRSRGNVSNFVGYINPQCQIIDMVTLYQEKKKVQ
jgi:hypothetical protein